MEPSDLQALMGLYKTSAARSARLEVALSLLEWLRRWDSQLPTDATRELLNITTNALDKDAPRAKAA